MAGTIQRWRGPGMPELGFVTGVARDEYLTNGSILPAMKLPPDSCSASLAVSRLSAMHGLAASPLRVDRVFVRLDSAAGLEVDVAEFAAHAYAKSLPFALRFLELKPWNGEGLRRVMRLFDTGQGLFGENLRTGRRQHQPLGRN